MFNARPDCLVFMHCNNITLGRYLLIWGLTANTVSRMYLGVRRNLEHKTWHNLLNGSTSTYIKTLNICIIHMHAQMEIFLVCISPSSIIALMEMEWSWVLEIEVLLDFIKHLHLWAFVPCLLQQILAVAGSDYSLPIVCPHRVGNS